MKRFLLFSLTLAFIATAAIGAEFLGSKQSNKYHFPTCKWARKITRENLVVFPSPEDAIKAGYKPCKVCRPPEQQQPPPKDGNGRTGPAETN